MLFKNQTFLLALSLTICCHFSFGQNVVFPGDANNNGIVDNIDLLYVGHAFDAVGPARQTTGSDFEGQTIDQLWSESFPDGTNFAYADADGDGAIFWPDLFAVFLNYGMTHGNVEPVEFLEGNIDEDPQLQLLDESLPEQITENTEIQIPIVIGNEDFPVESLNGLAFTISYDETLIQSVQIDFSEGWANTNNDLFLFQNFASSATNELDVGLTRYGQNPISGHGPIGTVSIIIEDNLVDLLPEDSTTILLQIRDIYAVDEDLNNISVASDSLVFWIYHPDALTSTDDPIIDINDLNLSYFPNPANNTVTIKTPVEIDQFQLLNNQGMVLKQQYYWKPGLHEMDLGDVPNGIYFIHFQWYGRSMSQKLIVQKD